MQGAVYFKVRVEADVGIVAVCRVRQGSGSRRLTLDMQIQNPAPLSDARRSGEWFIICSVSLRQTN